MYIFCFIFSFTSSSPRRKDQFGVSYFSASCYWTDPGLQLGDPAPVCRCGLADFFFFYVFWSLISRKESTKQLPSDSLSQVGSRSAF